MADRPILFSAPMVRAMLAGTKTQTRRVAKPKRSIEPMTDECPYGQPGDLLWVRETWAWYGCERDPREVLYRADTSNLPESHGRWRPSIHMPRWASRITLRVTGVRVERLQDITEVDAIAEGAQPFRLPCHPQRETLRHVDGFALLWESINGAGSWDANPWVWVVEFERVQGRGDG